MIRVLGLNTKILWEKNSGVAALWTFWKCFTGESNSRLRATSENPGPSTKLIDLVFWQCVYSPLPLFYYLFYFNAVKLN